MDSSSSTHIKHYCQTCGRELTGECYILCTCCHGFIQCTSCFAAGYEKGTHIKTHPYIIMEPSTLPIFTSDWCIEEELVLLDAVCKCGLGNWIEIAKHIQSKTADECEAHYFGVYFDIETAPKPSTKIRDSIPIPPPLPFSTEAISSIPFFQPTLNNKTKAQLPAEFCKFMPLRGEFDTQYNEDAEQIITDITFDDENETEESFNAKLERLNSFNFILDERRRRTKTIIDWDVHMNNFNGLGGGEADEKETDSKILPLSPYIGKEKTIALANYLHQQRRKKEEIDHQLLWQANKVPDIDQGFLYLDLKKFIKKGQISESDVSKWNEQIENFNKKHENNLIIDSNMLSERENELCKILQISTPLYLVLKDGIIRQYAAKGFLSREEAIRIRPDMEKKIGAMYDLFVSNGWIVSK